jgi:hypothetical protein
VKNQDLRLSKYPMLTNQYQYRQSILISKNEDNAVADPEVFKSGGPVNRQRFQPFWVPNPEFYNNNLVIFW